MSLQANRKTRAAALSVVSNSMLIIMKVIVGIMTNSVSIISEAIHSTIDLIAAIIAMISVRLSSKPADKNHPYGHGKIENISGVLEGILIFGAAVLIIAESSKKIFNPHPLQVTGTAIGIMLASAVINFIVSSTLYRAAREEDSIALEADALHLKTDVYTSAGVGMGLIIIKLTGVKIIDPIAAILVALLIIREAWELCCRAFNPLLDSSLPEREEKIILDILEEHANKDLQFAHLRTRKAGPYRFVDFHARITPTISVKKADEMTRHIKKEIQSTVPNAHVHINLESKED